MSFFKYDNIRYQLMSYINTYTFFEDPERAWRELIKENRLNNQYSLFPNGEGDLLLKKKINTA